VSAQHRIYQEWFEVWEAEPGVHVIAENLHFERVRSYLIEGEGRAILLDTGMGVGDIRAVVEDLTSLPITVLNSHAHWDHIGGNWRFNEILIHAAEADDIVKGRDNASLKKWFKPDLLYGPLASGTTIDNVEIKSSRATTILTGDERLELGGRALELMHTPGHSEGGLVVLDRQNGIVFTTDVAYLAPLYCYSPWTNVFDYQRSLVKLEAATAGMRAAYPSHDQTPFAPEAIGRMRVAFDEIIAGRQAEKIEGEIATHLFGDFSVMVPSAFRADGRPA
jgi:glyoxylase-like metal-dependent hydrolase (beta-lactamase superfamily II)